MSKMIVQKDYFRTRAEVMEDIRDTGYWPTTFISNRSPELPIHFHNHDIIGYVMEGEVTERVVYIVSLRDAIPLREGIMPQEPRGPLPSFE